MGGLDKNECEYIILLQMKCGITLEHSTLARNPYVRNRT
ncbi:MAG: hypothetical protein BAJALOKI1v1_1430002 [Promethearchaeota archaeon]|nr:MAG: hypothetical protein BAJALOKI1v1_1430002 [Candidatus Lokiarchaeota archaeon]